MSTDEGYVFSESAVRKIKADHDRLAQIPYGDAGAPHHSLAQQPEMFPVRFQNVGTVAMPAFGVGFASLIDVGSGGRFGRMSVRVTNSSASSCTGLLVNGPKPVAVNGYGVGYINRGPVLALCDNTHSFTVGSVWGPSAAAGDWKLHKGFDGFLMASTASATTGSDKIVPVTPSRGVVRRFQLTENWGYYTNPKTGPFTLTGKLLDSTPVSGGGTLENPAMEVKCYFSDEGDTFGSTGNGRCPNALSGDQVLVVCDAAFEWRVVSSWIWDEPIGTVKFFNSSYSGVPRGWAVMNGTDNATGNGGSNVNLVTAFLYLTSAGGFTKSVNMISSSFAVSDHTNGGNSPFGNTLTHTVSGNKTADPGGTTGAWTGTLSWMTGAGLVPYERLNNGVLKT